MLIGDGIQERRDAAGLVVEAEVSRGEHRHGCSAALEEVGQDSDQVTRLLRVGGDEDLVLYVSETPGGKRFPSAA